jgi:hypothetical protein
VAGVTADPWAEFENGLAAEIPLMREHDTVVLTHDGYYVQLTQNAESLTAEAVSNAFLKGERRLTPEQNEMLAKLGWNAPEPPPGQENWWSELPWPAGSTAGREFARRITRTLRDVYGIPGPADLSYRAWHYLTNEQLEWPLFTGLRKG